MKIVIDKDTLIKFFTLTLHTIVGGHYENTKETVTELVERIDYTPLPTGHGRLGDLDKLENHLLYLHKVMSGSSVVEQAQKRIVIELIELVMNAPTIIETDKGEE